MTYVIAFLCLLQAVLAVIIMYFLTQVPSLTPRWPWKHPFSPVLERLMSTGINMAWMGYMILMIYIASALALGELDAETLLEMLAMGNTGLFLAFTFGAVILSHFAWFAWRADHQRFMP
jgi:hypothetical protein